MALFSDSWTLTKTSFRILRERPSLLVLPGLAALVGLAILALFTLPVLGVYLANPAGLRQFVGTSAGLAVMIALYVGLYFTLVFVGNFFLAALVAAAASHFEGRAPSVSYGLQIARARVRRILLWSLVAASVGLAIQLIASRFRGLASIVIRVSAGTTWSIATFFVIPVIVFENAGPWASLKRSAGLFGQTFGKTLLSNLYLALLTIALVIVGLVPIFYAIVVAATGGSLLVAVGLGLLGAAVLAFGLILSATLQGLLRMALYRYATTGRAVTGLVPRDYQVGAAPAPLPS